MTKWLQKLLGYPEIASLNWDCPHIHILISHAYAFPKYRMTRIPDAVSRNTQLLTEKSATEVTDYISFFDNLFSHILLSHFLHLISFLCTIISLQILC